MWIKYFTISIICYKLLVRSRSWIFVFLCFERTEGKEGEKRQEQPIALPVVRLIESVVKHHVTMARSMSGIEFPCSTGEVIISSIRKWNTKGLVYNVTDREWMSVFCYFPRGRKIFDSSNKNICFRIVYYSIAYFIIEVKSALSFSCNK